MRLVNAFSNGGAYITYFFFRISSTLMRAYGQIPAAASTAGHWWRRESPPSGCEPSTGSSMGGEGQSITQQLQLFQPGYAQVPIQNVNPALPGVYEEAMAQLITNDHSTHFLNPDVSSVTIIQISMVEALSPNFGRECILNNLIIDNCIPLEWIQHGFQFGFQYMVEHLVDEDHHYEKHHAAYGQMLDLLDSRGISPAYPPWDGWFHPLVHDWE